MASKFNVKIEGGSGSIIMGDNTNVNIRSFRGSSAGAGRGTDVDIQQGPAKQAPRSAAFTPNVHVQETLRDETLRYQIRQGYALIIHNEYFPNRSVPDRAGSEQDVKAIKYFCNEAGLMVNDTDRETKNLTASQIDNLCSEIARRDFSRYDAFICFILSHGCEEGIQGTDDNPVSVQDIVSKFKDNSGLAGKPKLFFIQACRGTNKDGGVDADSHPVQERTPLRLPRDSDTLIAYSSVEGFESYRNLEDGSWFIITLMKTLTECAHNMHLMDILTLVNNQIAGFKTPSGKKQMSCQMSTLTKFVYFKYPSPLGP